MAAMSEEPVDPALVEPGLDPPLVDPETAVVVELEVVADGLEEGRRYPSTIGGLFYLVILGVTAVGIAVAWSGDWRGGVRWVAGGLVAASVLRLVLPRKDAGMLAVRNRLFDTLLLAVVGGLLFFLTATIPYPPPV